MPPAIRDEQGFTLIELLVVILIIGILAAIALPTMLGQREKAQDTDAKSNARSLVSHVEACFATTQSYLTCTESGGDLGTTGLPLGTGRGQVEVSTTATDYTVTAHSRSGGDFVIKRSTTTGFDRTCSGGTAGCKGGTW